MLAAATMLAARAGAPTAAYAGTAALSAVYWDAAHQRWRDAPTTPYDNGKIATYDYASATVVFAYQDHGTTIGGEITGSNLKPNSAYQLKLNGKPSYFRALAGTDLANDRTGFAVVSVLNKWAKAAGAACGA